jgi:hypothetical protein
MYLLTAVADLIRIEPTKHSLLLTATQKLWDNMVDKKMELTTSYLLVLTKVVVMLKHVQLLES